MPDTLLKTNNPGNNISYPTGETQAAHEIIKDTWERNQFKFVTRRNCQHAIKKKIVAAVFPESIQEKKKQKKLFTGISVHELIEYIMVRYGNINEPIKQQ